MLVHGVGGLGGRVGWIGEKNDSTTGQASSQPDGKIHKQGLGSLQPSRQASGVVSLWPSTQAVEPRRPPMSAPEQRLWVRKQRTCGFQSIVCEPHRNACGQRLRTAPVGSTTAPVGSSTRPVGSRTIQTLRTIETPHYIKTNH